MAKEIEGKQLAEFVVKTKYEDIPKEVREYAKILTLKTVSGMVAGSVKPSGQKMAGLIKGMKASEEVGVIGSGFKTGLWEAVLLHAYFAHASELEDDRFNGGVAWDIGVIPLLFPLGEKLKLSGKALIESIALGMEVHTRTCLFGGEHLGLVMVGGAAGPAVGAAKALGLGVKETAAALGLATSGACLWIQSFGTDAHYFESALQSLEGVIAAQMAKIGLAGNPNIGAYLRDHLGEKVVPEKIAADLGKHWVFCEIWVKKYPCCFLLHRQIDSVIELKKEHNFSLEEIEAVEVHASPADKPCNRPEPQNEGDLQFSFQHVLSTALMEGDVNMKHFTKEVVDNPRLKKARSKVKFILYPELSDKFLAAPSKLIIKMKDGRQFTKDRIFPIGHPKEPLTTEQVRKLCAKFMEGVLPENKISTMSDMILNLEKIGNVKEIIDILI
jgi:2-methylcitrate dehydratase PrpD